MVRGTCGYWVQVRRYAPEHREKTATPWQAAAVVGKHGGLMGGVFMGGVCVHVRMCDVSLPCGRACM